MVSQENLKCQKFPGLTMSILKLVTGYTNNEKGESFSKEILHFPETANYGTAPNKQMTSERVLLAGFCSLIRQQGHEHTQSSKPPPGRMSPTRSAKLIFPSWPCHQLICFFELMMPCLRELELNWIFALISWKPLQLIILLQGNIKILASPESYVWNS